MTRQEQIEAISDLWHNKDITATEMAQRIKDIEQAPSNSGERAIFNHRIMKGAGYLRCPDCDKQL